MSKKEASSGGPPGGLSGCFSLSEFPYWSAEGSFRMPESGRVLVRPRGPERGSNQNSKETWKTRPENLNKAPQKSKSVEETFKGTGLRLSVQSSDRRSLAAQEVSGAEWGRAAFRSGRERRFRPEQARRLCPDEAKKLGTGVPRRLVWMTSGDPRNELICYE